MAIVACDRVLTPPPLLTPFAPASALSMAPSDWAGSEMLDANMAFSSEAAAVVVVRIERKREALPAALRSETEIVFS